MKLVRHRPRYRYEAECADAAESLRRKESVIEVLQKLIDKHYKGKKKGPNEQETNEAHAL